MPSRGRKQPVARESPRTDPPVSTPAFLTYPPLQATGHPADACLLLHAGQPSFLLVNRAAAEIAEALGRGEEPEAVAVALAARSGVPPARVRQDVSGVRRRLETEGFLGRAAFARPRALAPETLYVQVTSRCNLSCLHCHLPRSSSVHDLPLGLLFRLIDEAAGNGCRRLDLSGGEPLLHPEIDRVLARAASKTGVLLVSNGALIDRARAASLASLGVRVQLSLESHRREVHDAVRGPGAFDRVMRALGHLRDAGMVHRVSLSTTILAPNVEDLPGVVSLAERWGVRGVGFRPPVRQGWAAYNWDTVGSGLTVEDHERFFRHVLRRQAGGRRRVSVNAGMSGFMLAPPDEGCGDGRWCRIGRTAAVDASGGVYPCSLMMLEPFRLGNLRGEGLQGIFRSSGMEGLRRLVEGRAEANAACRRCAWKGLCQAGCPALALDHAGSVRGVDRFCAVRQGAYREAFHGLLARQAPGARLAENG